MRAIITIITLLLVSGSFADEGKGKNIEERKANIISRADKKIASLNEFKTCIGAASQKGDIKKCRKAKKERMASIKEERMAMKEERKAMKAERKSQKNKWKEKWKNRNK